ncbi:hypothetical protein SLG_15620 [Sphingobium sp. SYK-6]|uniref:TauD/TfdA family dioxygenase n=1 Tax=Sphingobium sp. (strain NBRC 103272 / SYK-6) TaxID=627192 RepID=UPI0002277772|nr:TauD/TfdA family dioxygenase [Sphingobium sp. SYK-6]BAK66237.1 hypothetical protein SLG_15620 [Sphingobium sp. SYK-6]
MADIDAAIERPGTDWTRLGEPSGAWTSESGGGAEGLTRRLSPAQIDALDAAVRATEGRAATDVTADDFGAPELRALMAAARYDIMAGRGAVLLSGIDIGRYDLEQFKRLHFGLGTHLGMAAEQSPRHDRIGLVRKEPNPDRRGYLTDTELGPHTDYHEILSLACVVASEEGGVSGFVSAAAVYEALRRERPDLLDALLEGYHYPTSLETVTDYKVPTFSVVDGHVAIYNYVIYIAQAAQIRGEPVPPRLVEALRCLFAIAKRPEFMISFTLQPGEIVFWHNFRVMHSRTSFRNSPGRERTLLRLWLHAHETFPMARGYHEIGRILDRQHGEGWSMLVNTDESLRAVYELVNG